MLIFSVLIGLISLAGVGLIFYQDPAITVDNLFISLMLLTISGVFLLNAALELRGRLTKRKKESQPAPAKAAAPASLGAAAAVPSGESTAPRSVAKQRGIVREVQFFEALVGLPNKSIVTLQLNGANSARVLAFEGDLRNALPVGKKVEISYRENGGTCDLQERQLRVDTRFTPGWLGLGSRVRARRGLPRRWSGRIRDTTGRLPETAQESHRRRPHSLRRAAHHKSGKLRQEQR